MDAVVAVHEERLGDGPPFGGLLVQEAILPVQFFHRHRADGPEVTLIVAVIEVAVRDYLLPDTSVGRHRLRADAEAWFESPGADAPSFLWCCQQIGLEPTAVRARLAERRTEPPGRPAPRMRDVRSGPRRTIG